MGLEGEAPPEPVWRNGVLEDPERRTPNAERFRILSLLRLFFVDPKLNRALRTRNAKRQTPNGAANPTRRMRMLLLPFAKRQTPDVRRRTP